MDKRLDEIRSEIREGSTTFHAGSGEGPGPLKRFLGAALGVALTAAALGGVTAAAWNQTRGPAAPGAEAALAAKLDPEVVADFGRYTAARDLVRALNRQFDRKIALHLAWIGPQGPQESVIGGGADVTVCTAYPISGPSEQIGIFTDRAFSWTEEKTAARAAFQHQVALMVAGCLQDAGVTGRPEDPLKWLARYDQEVQAGQSRAMTAMIEGLVTGGFDAAQHVRDELRDNADGASARRHAEIIDEVVRGGVERLRNLSSYEDLAAEAGRIAAARMGFGPGAAPFSVVAPDGTEVSLQSGSAEFGWRAERDGDSGLTVYERRFGDPELSAERARNEAEAAEALAADGGEVAEADPEFDDAPQGGGEDGEELYLDEEAQADRDNEYAENALLYRGRDERGRECREYAVDYTAPDGPTTTVGAACQNPDGTWSVVAPSDLTREGVVAPAAFIGDGWESPSGKYRKAELGDRGWVVRGEDVGHGAAQVVVRRDGTNVFQDADGHTVALVGGPRKLNVGIRTEDGQTVRFDLDEGPDAGRRPGM